MLSLFKINIPTNKKIISALTIIYGINRSKALTICNELGLNTKITVKRLSKPKLNQIVNYVNLKIKIEEQLKNKNYSNFQNLLEIKSYKGLRHFFGLPSNGQRTHTNKKTATKLKQKWIKKI